MDNNWKKRLGVVYSTNSEFAFKNEKSEDEQETISIEKQVLYVSIDRKHRKGKIVTVISNFKGMSEDIDELAKLLKKRCGSGGSVKDSDILIQGEKRDIVIRILNSEGYKTKLKGG